jgi:hypothetical protein
MRKIRLVFFFVFLSLSVSNVFAQRATDTLTIINSTSYSVICKDFRGSLLLKEKTLENGDSFSCVVADNDIGRKLIISVPEYKNQEWIFNERRKFMTLKFYVVLCESEYLEHPGEKIGESLELIVLH